MADNGVPEWGAEVRADVAFLKATVIAIDGRLTEVKRTLDAHCAKTNGDNMKKWLFLGLGIGAGVGGTGTALAKFLGL